ncbi:MAG TPA: carbohydrate ABC transporter permease [Chloroflexota bacterium]|nr:carbohydrate ABC transporter permease [Chloroflexota bacterium]
MSATTAPGRGWSRARTRRTLKLALTLVLAAVYFLPIYWMAKSSFQTERDIRVTELNLGIALSGITLSNYASALTNEKFTTWFYNSTLLAVSTMLVAVTTATLAAYSLARLPTRLTSVVGRFFLMAYISPGVMVIIPLFILLTNLGLQNTYQGLIITYSSFAVPFGTWLLIGYFRTLPVELEDAALIDGCSRLGALWRVVLPLSTPAIVTVALFAFVLAWNDLLFAIVFTRTDAMQTLSSGLVAATSTVVGSDNPAPGSWGFGAIFAVCMLVAAPVIAVFVILQNWLVSGLSAGAIKG